MPFRPLLLLNITFIKDDKIYYPGVFAFVVALGLAVLAGIWLWLIGLDLVRSRQPGRRVGGVLVLAVAATYSLAIIGLLYWEAGQLLAML